MQASIGNKLACDSLEQNLDNAYLWQFGFANMACFGSICLMCLYQNFITVWVGKDMILPQIDIILLSILLYVMVIQHAFNLYITGAGLWWNLRHIYIIGAVSNLILNIILCSSLKTTGIIISTILSQAFFGYFCQTRVLFKDLFKTDSLPYHFRNLRYFAVYVCLGASMFGLCQLIKVNDWLGLFIKAALCALIIPGILFLLYRKNAFLPFFMDYFRGALSHFFHTTKCPQAG